MIILLSILFFSVSCDQRLTSCGTKVTDENEIIDVVFLIEYSHDCKNIIESLKSLVKRVFIFSYTNFIILPIHRTLLKIDNGQSTVLLSVFINENLIFARQFPDDPAPWNALQDTIFNF